MVPRFVAQAPLERDGLPIASLIVEPPKNLLTFRCLTSKVGDYSRRPRERISCWGASDDFVSCFLWHGREAR